MDLTGIGASWLPLERGPAPLADAAILRDLRGEGGGGPRSPEATRQALRLATREFEAVFLNQMIEAMRRTVGEGGLVRKSNAERIFEGMLDEEWSRKLAGRSGQGSLGGILYEQLSRRMGLEEDAAASPEAGEGPSP